MTIMESANDSPYWPPCIRAHGFMPWFSRLCLLARNSQATPTQAACCLEGVPTEWAAAARFLLTCEDRPAAASEH